MEVAPSLGFTVEEADLELYDAYTADEIIICGTAGGLLAVVHIDGRVIGAGKPGPVLTPGSPRPTSGCSTRRSTAPTSNSNCRRRAEARRKRTCGNKDKGGGEDETAPDVHGAWHRVDAFRPVRPPAQKRELVVATSQTDAGKLDPHQASAGADKGIAQLGVQRAGAHQAGPGEPGIHRAGSRRELDCECQRHRVDLQDPQRRAVPRQLRRVHRRGRGLFA